MKLTKSETEKLTIALFKIARTNPTTEIGQAASHLQTLIDAEAAREEMAAKHETAEQPSLPLEHKKAPSEPQKEEKK